MTKMRAVREEYIDYIENQNISEEEKVKLIEEFLELSSKVYKATDVLVDIKLGVETMTQEELIAIYDDAIKDATKCDKIMHDAIGKTMFDLPEKDYMCLIKKGMEQNEMIYEFAREL